MKKKTECAPIFSPGFNSIICQQPSNTTSSIILRCLGELCCWQRSKIALQLVIPKCEQVRLHKWHEAELKSSMHAQQAIIKQLVCRFSHLNHMGPSENLKNIKMCSLKQCSSRELFKIKIIRFVSGLAWHYWYQWGICTGTCSCRMICCSA